MAAPSIGALVSAIALALGPLVRRATMLKNMLRPTFGAETTYTMNNRQIVRTGPASRTLGLGPDRNRLLR